MPVIEVKNLCKTFKSVKKDKGLKGALKSLLKKRVEMLKAVDDVSFAIDKGEIVAYIGPNGAGKSTTVKMMSGILTPTSGEILVNGLSPQKDRKKVVMGLGVVFGQRSQLYWDLRLGETFELLKRIYRIDDETYKENYEMMCEILSLDEFMDTPVRQLSLGQRMRGDLAAAMLHSPDILFLDEPTIGLDVEAKHAIRDFIKKINRTKGTTVILTTHDLGDIEELCSRIIIINKGRIIEDGSLSALIERIAPTRRLVVDFYEEQGEFESISAQIVKREGARVTFEFLKADITAAKLISDISLIAPIKDIRIEEAKIEDIIRVAYKGDEE